MGWIRVGIPLVAAWVFGFAERPVLAWTSVAVALMAVALLRMRYTHALESARKRREALVEELRREGKLRGDADQDGSGPLPLSREDRRAAPGWVGKLDATAAAAGVLLLAWALLI